MSDSVLSSDIYDIADFVDAIKKKYVEDETEDTLMMGIYGYMSAIFSNELQNAIRVASQYSNEAIPTKAKFEKNILTHALTMGMDNINAVPARMIVLMCFPEDKLSEKMGNTGTADEFVFSKEIPITIEGYEYHTDYDIIISRRAGKPDKFVSGLDVEVTYTYTARYDMDDRTNPLSDITNPNLSSVTRIKLSGDDVMVAIPLVTIRQVELYDVTRKILTNNPLENKVINFSFSDQLAEFYVEVVESGSDEPIYLTPVYEGAYITTTDLYCYYTYIDSETIRIKFNSDSYSPTLNADVTIHSYLTKGAEATFSYDTDVAVTLESSDYDYSGLYVVLSPATGSENGSDKKSVDSIKKSIAAEALARGSVTNTSDLESFFNSLSDEDNKLYFYKKRHNLREVIYYAYGLMRNSFGNIVPTNTVNIELEQDMIVDEDGNLLENYVIHPGEYQIYLDPADSSGLAKINYKNEEIESDTVFKYISPFLCNINITENYVSYYLTTLNMDRELSFDYINPDSSLQFVATTINWDRRFSEIYSDDIMTDEDGVKYFKYTMTIDMTQNIGSDYGVIIENTDDDGNIINYSTEYDTDKTNPTFDSLEDINTIVAIAVFYLEDDTGYTNPQVYNVGKLVGYDSSELIYSFQFDYYTDDTMNSENSIRLVNLKDPNSNDNSPLRTNMIIDGNTFDFDNMKLATDSTVDTYFSQNMNMRIYVLLREPPVEYADMNRATDSEYLSDIITITGNNSSTLNDSYSLTNIYSVPDGIDMYYNFTNVMESEIAVTETVSGGVTQIAERKIRTVPLIKYDYIRQSDLDTTEEAMREFTEVLEERLSYIDYCLEVLEDALDIDYKFFNTYGPSNKYFLDLGDTTGEAVPISRVDITLEFNLKLINNSYATIVDKIKTYVKEVIEDIDSVEDIHISNIITEVTTEYSEYITYFEFVTFNYDDEDGNYGPGCSHILEQEDDGKLEYTPEFLNVRNNEHNGPDIVINLV